MLTYSVTFLGGTSDQNQSAFGVLNSCTTVGHRIIMLSDNYEPRGWLCCTGFIDFFLIVFYVWFGFYSWAHQPSNSSLFAFIVKILMLSCKEEF